MKKIDRREAVQKIERQIDLIKTIKYKDDIFIKWRRDTEIAISYIFGTDTRHLKEFKKISYSGMVFPADDSYYAECFYSGLKRADSMLRSFVDEIKEYWGDDGHNDIIKINAMNNYIQSLHPYIANGCAKLYNDGYYMQAVGESVKAVFQYIRDITGETLDSHKLACRVFSSSNPILAFSDLSDETKKNEQVGFMTMLKGFAVGVRNPIAHTYGKTEDSQKAFEYLTMASLFCRRIDDAVNYTRREHGQ